LQNRHDRGNVIAVKRLLSLILVLTALLANVSWATDSHSEAWVGHGAEVSQGWMVDDHDNDHAGCDHCCHGFAHIVGLAPQLSQLMPIPLRTTVSLPERRYRSHSPAPLIPPPNA